MIVRRLQGRWPLAAGLLLGAASCVPDLPRAAAPRRDGAIAAARPLLDRMALKVAADDGASVLPSAPAAAAPPFVVAATTTSDAVRATECLTAAVYYEARSEPVDGQRAVAQVVLNRVRDRAYPASVCGVVYQGSGRSTGCQFSFTCDGSMRAARDDNAWTRARAVAEAALAGAVYAPVGTATSYHAASITPWWAPSLTRIGQIGAHVFYRWHDALERALGFRQRYAGFEPVIGGFSYAAVSTTSGVQVHYDDRTDTEQVFGVTVHRSGVGTAASVTEAAPLPVARTATVSGVRLHLDHPAATATPPEPATTTALAEQPQDRTVPVG